MSGYQKGEAHHSSVLTEADVLRIRSLHADGISLKQLSAEYPQCSKPNLHHIINGRRWKYLSIASPSSDRKAA
jgi:hypothetical protein